MQEDGSEPRRLTNFNDPRADEYLGPTHVAAFDWDPAGDRIVAHLVYGSDARHALFLLQLAPSFRR